MMERVVLTELEGFKTIDNDFRWRRGVFHLFCVKQEAMAGHALEVPVYCPGVHLQVSGNLPVSHSSDGFHEDFLIKIWSFLPVCCAECLCTEGDFACLACKPLDTPVVYESFVEACFFEGEVFR